MLILHPMARLDGLSLSFSLSLFLCPSLSLSAPSRSLSVALSICFLQHIISCLGSLQIHKGGFKGLF